MAGAMVNGNGFPEDDARWVVPGTERRGTPIRHSWPLRAKERHYQEPPGAVASTSGSGLSHTPAAALTSGILIERLSGSGQLAVVGFFQQLDDRLSRLALPQEVAEVVIAQVTRNVFECSQVIAGAIRRRNQQE